MKKSLFITVAFLLVNTVAFSQSGKLNRANRHFEKGNYDKAIVLYNKVVKKNMIEEAVVNLAWSYIKVENPQEAEYWFGRASIIKDTSIDYQLYYAAILGINYKCDLGHTPLKKSKEINPSDKRIEYVEEFLEQGCRKKESQFDWSNIMSDLD